MIAHTVYKGRRNEIVLQLLSEDAPLENPAAIDRVAVCISGVDVDTTSPHVEYDDSEGVLTMRLGMVPEVQDLPSRVYRVSITAYGQGDTGGIAFPGLTVSLKDWCG